MKLGTRSVLYGAHAFWLHPFFVARAWTQLFGFPWDPRLWVAFFVHDLGYLGKPNMDGPEGEDHPELGARIMSALFDWPRYRYVTERTETPIGTYWQPKRVRNRYWYRFTRYHSRFLAKRDGAQPSPLCLADKLATILTPRWLYLPMVKATGEVWEYLRMPADEAMTPNERAGQHSGRVDEWYAAMSAYMRRWVDVHRDGRPDEWTGAGRWEARDDVALDAEAAILNRSAVSNPSPPVRLVPREG